MEWEEYKNRNNNLKVGDRVLVFDHLLYKNDEETPLSVTMKQATIVQRYGAKTFPSLPGFGKEYAYPDLVDIKFDHREEISKGYFIWAIEPIKNEG